MRKNNFCFGWLVFFLSITRMDAQVMDTTLSVQQFITLVQQFHPVLLKTNIGIQQSNANRLQARGAFDPVLQANTGNKTLDGLTYYNQQTAELSIPTWYGIEFKTGYEYWDGSRLNPSQTSGGVGYAGVQIPLVKNLVFDKRRAALQQAVQIQGMAQEEQKIITNQLLYDGLQAYFDWVQSWEMFQLADRNLQLNQQRMQLIRKSFEYGDRAAIDTLEAYTLVQQFELLRNQHYLEFIRDGIYLSGYLWTQDNKPYTLPVACKPNTQWKGYGEAWGQQLNIDSMLYIVQDKHPSVRWYERKLRTLELERKLKFQELLPKIDVQYQLLSKKGLSGFNPAFEGFAPNQNAYYGIKLLYPLRVSEGRANYQQSKLKLSDAQLDFEIKKVELGNKLKKAVNDFILIQKQVELQTNYVLNLQQLASAEQKKLEFGESSFFMTNTRENKVIEASEKLIQLQIKRKMSLISLPFALGNLPN
jgi:outer membrane protein TolC